MGSIFQIILQRLALGLVTLLVVSMVIFVAVNALPGDFAQAILGQGATDEAVTQIRADLGLDQNYFLRYFGWLGNVLTGNLGISFAQMNFASNMGGDQLVGVAGANHATVSCYHVFGRCYRDDRSADFHHLGYFGRFVSQFAV